MITKLVPESPCPTSELYPLVVVNLILALNSGTSLMYGHISGDREM